MANLEKYKRTLQLLNEINKSYPAEDIRDELYVSPWTVELWLDQNDWSQLSDDVLVERTARIAETLRYTRSLDASTLWVARSFGSRPKSGVARRNLRRAYTQALAACTARRREHEKQARRFRNLINGR